MFRLALALGKDVREIEAWPSPLLSEWLAYHMLEPIPDANWHAGLIASTMCNLWSKSKTRPSDFIPRVKPQRQSPEEMLAKFRGIADYANARHKSTVINHQEV